MRRSAVRSAALRADSAVLNAVAGLSQQGRRPFSRLFAAKGLQRVVQIVQGHQPLEGRTSRSERGLIRVRQAGQVGEQRLVAEQGRAVPPSVSTVSRRSSSFGEGGGLLAVVAATASAIAILRRFASQDFRLFAGGQQIVNALGLTVRVVPAFQLDTQAKGGGSVKAVGEGARGSGFGADVGAVPDRAGRRCRGGGDSTGCRSCRFLSSTRRPRCACTSPGCRRR